MFIKWVKWVAAWKRNGIKRPERPVPVTVVEFYEYT